jgi:mannose-6-phosphate isomerase-like protein (cupin superfamily)
MPKNNDVPVKKEKLGGCGEGTALFYGADIPDADGAFTMAAKISLEKGASVGYHTHKDNEEVYTIISGSGTYTDDGKDIDAKPGDVFLCRKGHSHGLKNTGSEPLVFGAAIATRE